MVADAKQGNRAVINIAPSADANRGEIEDRVRERMKYYSTSYAIEWAGADSAHSPRLDIDAVSCGGAQGARCDAPAMISEIVVR